MGDYNINKTKRLPVLILFAAVICGAPVLNWMVFYSPSEELDCIMLYRYTYYSLTL